MEVVPVCAECWSLCAGGGLDGLGGGAGLPLPLPLPLLAVIDVGDLSLLLRHGHVLGVGTEIVDVASELRLLQGATERIHHLNLRAREEEDGEQQGPGTKQIKKRERKKRQEGINVILQNVHCNRVREDYGLIGVGSMSTVSPFLGHLRRANGTDQ